MKCVQRQINDLNQIYLFLRTELVSNNVFAKIVSEGRSSIFIIQISAAYF